MVAKSALLGLAQREVGNHFAAFTFGPSGRRVFVVTGFLQVFFAVKKNPCCLRCGNEPAKNTYWGVVAEMPTGGFGIGGELRSP